MYTFFYSKPNTTSDWPPLSKDESAPWVQLHISHPNEIYVDEINESLGNRAFWKSLGFEENEKLLKIHDELWTIKQMWFNLVVIILIKISWTNQHVIISMVLCLYKLKINKLSFKAIRFVKKINNSKHFYTVTPTSPRISDNLSKWTVTDPNSFPDLLLFNSWKAFMYSSSENSGPLSTMPFRIS